MGYISQHLTTPSQHPHNTLTTPSQRLKTSHNISLHLTTSHNTLTTPSQHPHNISQHLTTSYNISQHPHNTLTTTSPHPDIPLLIEPLLSWYQTGKVPPLINAPLQILEPEQWLVTPVIIPHWNLCIGPPSQQYIRRQSRQVVWIILFPWNPSGIDWPAV